MSIMPQKGPNCVNSEISPRRTTPIWRSSSSAAASRQDGQFASAAEAIHQSMQDMPDLAKLSQQVITEVTPEGLRIQLVDQDGRPMFQPGTAEPMPYTKKLLAEIGKIVDRLPNRIAIAGHTSGTDACDGER